MSTKKDELTSSSDYQEVASFFSSMCSIPSNRCPSDNDPTVAPDIPKYIYMKPEIANISPPCTPTDYLRSSFEEQLTRNQESPRTVSDYSETAATDAQQAQISTDELQGMKRMIRDLKNNPDLIYKRLCVRYDDKTIRRGSAVMDELQARL